MFNPSSARHFAGAIIYRSGEDGPEYLVIEYDSGQGVQIKFPGGTDEHHPGETMQETLHREVREETNLVIKEKKFPVVFEKKIPSSNGRSPHVKMFHAIPFEDCEGTLRTDGIMRDEGDRLSPPFWRTAEELDRVIFHSHAPALEGIRKRLR